MENKAPVHKQVVKGTKSAVDQTEPCVEKRMPSVDQQAKVIVEQAKPMVNVQNIVAVSSVSIEPHGLESARDNVARPAPPSNDLEHFEKRIKLDEVENDMQVELPGGDDYESLHVDYDTDVDHFLDEKDWRGFIKAVQSRYCDEMEMAVDALTCYSTAIERHYAVVMTLSLYKHVEAVAMFMNALCDSIVKGPVVYSDVIDKKLLVDTWTRAFNEHLDDVDVVTACSDSMICNNICSWRASELGPLIEMLGKTVGSLTRSHPSLCALFGAIWQCVSVTDVASLQCGVIDVLLKMLDIDDDEVCRKMAISNISDLGAVYDNVKAHEDTTTLSSLLDLFLALMHDRNSVSVVASKLVVSVANADVFSDVLFYLSERKPNICKETVAAIKEKLDVHMPRRTDRVEKLIGFIHVFQTESPMSRRDSATILKTPLIDDGDESVDSETIVTISEMNENLNDIQILCKCLGQLDKCSRNGLGRRTIVKSGGLDTIISCISIHGGNSCVVRGACTVLSSLVKNSHRKIMKAGGIQCIMETMKAHPGLHDVQESCLDTLRLLADQHADVVRDNGGLVLVTNVMQNCSDNARVQQYACAALCHLIYGQQCTGAWRNAVNTAVINMNQHINDVGVQQSALDMLNDICRSNREGIDIVASANDHSATRTIIKSMKRHSDDAFVQHWACATLGSLCSVSMYAHKVVDAGGIECVVNAMKTLAGDADVQCSAVCALCAICRSIDNKRKSVAVLVKIECKPAIIAAMDSHGDDVDDIKTNGRKLLDWIDDYIKSMNEQ